MFCSCPESQEVFLSVQIFVYSPFAFINSLFLVNSSKLSVSDNNFPIYNSIIYSALKSYGSQHGFWIQVCAYKLQTVFPYKEKIACFTRLQ